MNGDKSFTMSKTNKVTGTTNYKVWKVKMKMILMKERLWELVTGLLTIIVINPSEGGSTSATIETFNRKGKVVAFKSVHVISTKVVNPNSEIHRDKKNKVLMIMMMIVKDEIVPFTADVEELSVSWRTFQELFGNQNVVRTLYLTNKLHSMKMEEEFPITNFIRSFKELTVQLISIRGSIYDNMIVHIALNFLPTSYENFV